MKQEVEYKEEIETKEKKYPLKDHSDKFIFMMKQDLISEYVPMEKGDYPLHYHDHFEMEMVYRGSGSQLFDGKEFPLREKDICLLRPLDYHKIHSDGMTFHHIKVKENLIPKWALKRIHSFRNPIVFHLSDKDFNTMNQLFDLLADEIGKPYENMLETSTLLIELIFTYFFRLDKDNNYSAPDNFVMKVTYFLQHNNHFTDKVSLDQIAQYTGYSKYYTSSMFHKLYGMTIQDFIVYLRIEYAKKLILSTNHSMTEIITECGFSSTSNFYQKFTRLVGVSPLKFKTSSKENATKEEEEKKGTGEEKQKL